MMVLERSMRCGGAALLTIVACVGMLGCSANQPSAEHDQAAVISAALDYVAHEFPYGSETVCFDPVLNGSGLDEFRETIETFRAVSDRPQDDEAVRMALAGKEMGWQNPTATDGRYTAVNPELDRNLAIPFSRVLARSPSPTPFRRLTPVDEVPKRLTYKPDAELDSSCPSVISMSGPSVEGDTAFVETSYVCGSLCGNGDILALRRTSTGWRVVARSGTWVS